MKEQRIKKLLLALIILLLVGMGYAALCYAWGGGIPCPFHSVTGLLCPGCGVSRMLLSLLQLDFTAAWTYNAAILCLLPFGVAVAVDIAVRYVQTGGLKPDKWANMMVYGMIAVQLAFGVWRNI